MRTPIPNFCAVAVMPDTITKGAALWLAFLMAEADSPQEQAALDAFNVGVKPADRGQARMDGHTVYMEVWRHVKP